ncbi:hypothetical protein IHE45_16G053900 [Dioscorea alata]|uniref:Uncharacterized protein n=1 Tax=Dioscorea alata TaxID=55571 RepID=A0ACB7UHP2_DIOAL|nr:hypothetical protein IHE45_16G053900 [Dioscorea alata]
MRTGAGSSSQAAAPVTAAARPQHSAWHSPVPYLFGGLAAMLGLIAFALLLLACSYWKLSGYLEDGTRDADPEAGAASSSDGSDEIKPPSTFFEERILVIMAGDKKPTFLAMPMSSRASSFGDSGENTGKTKDAKGGGEEEKKEVLGSAVTVRDGAQNSHDSETHQERQ